MINALQIVSMIVSLAVLAVLIAVIKQLRNDSRKIAALKSREDEEKNLTKDEMGLLMRQMSANFAQQLAILGQNINGQTAGSQQQIEALRTAVGSEMRQIRQENSENLAEIRRTVDDKLQTTLEKRLSESFNRVGERLEQVHRGLGEMQNLAADVGDLQKLLRNVKIRGTWGEVQLGGILSQMLAPNQYEANVRPDPNGTAVVEYAVKIPDNDGGFIWLPLDAKCPLEDYRRLTAAEENGDRAEKAKALTALCARIKSEAKDIREKYICPPYTTDFAVLFLPLEGLFAEVLQQPDLCEALQKDYRVLVAGPTTLSALLNILQIGYRSAAIQARTDEVWQLLAEVKTEFARFGEAVAKSRKKLQEADHALEAVSRRTRAMERQLRDMETNVSERSNIDERQDD
ncbi:MAG: DNA recombination protein RmuC [Bacillota bacterium]|jgi:DNA recombination protein RmuC